jgi:Flp pilus assembly pilin Flp
MRCVRERLLGRVIRDERGISGVEYGLIIALIGAAVVGVIAILGHVLGSGYNGAASAVPHPAAVSSTPAGGAASGGTSDGAASAGSSSGGTTSGTPAKGVVPVVEEGATPTDTATSSSGDKGASGISDTGAGSGTETKAASGTTTACGPGYVTESSGKCVLTAKSSCVGDQIFDEATNTCLIPKCSGQVYDAASGKCVESAAPTCQANKQGYSTATNTCFACPVGWDSGKGTCITQVDCSADNKMPNQWNKCQSVDEYVGTLQGASLNGIKNGWVPQLPKTTRTYNVFSAADTSSWKNEPWILSTAPYTAEIVSVVVSDPSKGLSQSDIPVPAYTSDTLTITTPSGPMYAQYTITYTVKVTYPWNGGTKTATKVVSTRVGLQS